MCLEAIFVLILPELSKLTVGLAIREAIVILSNLNVAAPQSVPYAVTGKVAASIRMYATLTNRWSDWERPIVC